MDLKTFSEEDFDPKKWINKAWSSSGNQEKEIFVANTVTRLQLYMKQLTNSLDETTTQIVTSIPRVIQDASALQLEGALLQQKMLSLEEKVQGVEEQTGHSIQSLQRIDQMKSKLENAAAALQEADKWAALATSLEETLDSGVPTQADKLTELSERVAALTASLEIQSDAPDYDTKRVQLETLYNRLEVAITPPFIEALTQLDAERAGRYVRLMSGMGRLAAIARGWRRSAAARLANAANRTSAPVITALLADDAPSQVQWLTNVLMVDSPLSEMMRLYTDLLLSLEPSPTKVATASLRRCSNPESGIDLMIDLRNDIDKFISCIKGVIDAPKQGKDSILPATLREFGRVAYAPLRELLPQYTELQTQVFLAHLNDAQLQQNDLLEQSRALLSTAERCDSWLTSAYNKAKKIGHVAIYPYYAPAVEAFISKMSGRISSHSRRIETAFMSAVTAGQIAGVLSTTFPASLVLETAAAMLLDTLATRQKVEQEDPVPRNEDPLLDLPTLLLDPDTKQKLETLRAEPPASVGSLRRSKEHLRGLARAILRSPVDAQLDKIPQLSVWSNNDALTTDLPDFALSPQEYITEIGQYLMTLPQHLEMHLSEKQAPWQFLTEVCSHTCEVYAEKILNIRNMDALGTKRCLTDIVYLSSVVEDLGSNITPALKNLEKSLRAAAPSHSDQN